MSRILEQAINILSQDIEGQTNNSLCPDGWHIPTSFTNGVFGNYYADMEYIDYIFGFDWWHMMVSNVAENKDSRVGWLAQVGSLVVILLII